MTKFSITFDEVEHSGDLDNYGHDIIACGGKITSAFLLEEGQGIIEFEVEDKKDFINKFKATEANDFVSDYKTL